MAKVFLLFALFFFHVSSFCEENSVRLITGEYSPFTSAHLSENGLLTKVVIESFEAKGVEVKKVNFAPWKRASYETEQAMFDATFPYAKNRSREERFFYSDILHKGKLHFITVKEMEKDFQKEKNWKGKVICHPLGWNIEQVQEEVEKYQLLLTRTSDVETCFRLLAAKRVDLINLNITFAKYIIRNLYGDLDKFSFLKDKVKDDFVYLMVSKKNPRAKLIIDQFNEGLKKLKRNGRYRAILNESQSPR
ncbi:transporter substrate-binding domain-containing protein [Halobacteriovorax sp. GB3]|uniref:substrate-binding periplasmic protein n=1 Tax=Halobacteriovorax sp. GB3 TaxID=2719615 RepID=UPI00236140CC|nr:transporter substrate-binding domain-containing protein [Halobacteriovorax sp. GB3]MDD0853083.1 transporter substrate-binding domain-containing protein [Halobacteriovorax sp. GB3]